MIEIDVRTRIVAPPERILEFVMDVRRYAEVDAKISPIMWVHRTGHRVEFACRPKLAGVRQPTVVQFMELTPGRRIDIGLLPLPRNRLAHAIARFEASFEVVGDGRGSVVTRRLRFAFAPWARWVMEPLFRRRLPAEVRDELARASRRLEQRAPALVGTGDNAGRDRPDVC